MIIKFLYLINCDKLQGDEIFFQKGTSIYDWQTWSDYYTEYRESFPEDDLIKTYCNGPSKGQGHFCFVILYIGLKIVKP